MWPSVDFPSTDRIWLTDRKSEAARAPPFIVTFQLSLQRYRLQNQIVAQQANSSHPTVLIISHSIDSNRNCFLDMSPSSLISISEKSNWSGIYAEPVGSTNEDGSRDVVVTSCNVSRDGGHTFFPLKVEKHNMAVIPGLSDQSTVPGGRAWLVPKPALIKSAIMSGSTSPFCHVNTAGRDTDQGLDQWSLAGVSDYDGQSGDPGDRAAEEVVHLIESQCDNDSLQVGQRPTSVFTSLRRKDPDGTTADLIFWYMTSLLTVGAWSIQLDAPITGWVEHVSISPGESLRAAEIPACHHTGSGDQPIWCGSEIPLSWKNWNLLNEHDGYPVHRLWAESRIRYDPAPPLPHPQVPSWEEWNVRHSMS